MGSRALTGNDVTWIVTIMCRDSMVFRRRDMICLALGLTMGQLTDITRSRLTEDTGVFLTQVLHLWISSSTEPTFQTLVEVLRQMELNSIAHEIELKLELHPLPAHDFEENSPISLPGIWFDVPDRVHMFTGRVEYVKALHESIIGQNFNDPLNDSTVITAVRGMGGVGKTSLTIHYAWTFFNKFYVNVIWINSESVNTITNSFTKLARELGQNTSTELCEVVSGIYKYFRNSKTLIVFDNVELYEDIKPYLPIRSPNALRPYVLLSSRRRDWHLRTYVIDLDLFTVEESVEFFKVYLNLISEDELDFAGKISTELQNLPLAIRQAGAFIKVQYRGRETSLVDEMKSYLVSLRSNLVAILKFKHFEHTPDIYEKTVYSTWTVSMKKLAKKNDLTEIIIEFISYLNSDNIPVKLLYGIQRRGKSVEQSQVNSAVKLLSDFSLITKQNNELDTICVHRLLQKVVRVQIQSKNIESPQLILAISWMEIPLRLNNYDQYEDMCLIHALTVREHIPPEFSQVSNHGKSFVELIATKQSNSIDQRLRLLVDMLRERKYEKMFESYEKSRSIYTPNVYGVKNNTIDLFVLRLVNLICLEVQRDYELADNCDKILKHCEIIREIIEGFHISFYEECWVDRKSLLETAQDLYAISILENISLTTKRKEVISTVYCVLNFLCDGMRKISGSLHSDISSLCYMNCFSQTRHGNELVDFMNKLGIESERRNFYIRLGVLVMETVYYLNSERVKYLIREGVRFYRKYIYHDIMLFGNEEIGLTVINLLMKCGRGGEIKDYFRLVEVSIENNISTVQTQIINSGECIYKNSYHKNMIHLRDTLLCKYLPFYDLSSEMLHGRGRLPLHHE